VEALNDGTDEISPPFLFVVGCGRSGTTLLRAMLDSHPDLAVPGESYWLVGQGRLQRKYQPDALLDALVRSPRVRLWGLDPDSLSRAVREASNFADAVRSVYALYAVSQEKARYADKTPSYVLHIGFLSHLLPEARFIHIVRDGRNVAISIAGGHFGPNSLSRAMLYWRYHVSNGRASGSRIGSNYLEIRYEDLVEDPVATLSMACRFAGLEFAPEMLDYPARSDRVLRQTLSPDRHGNITRAPVAMVRDWRDELSMREVALLERLGGRLLEELGYGLSRPALGLWASVAVAARATVARCRFWLGRSVTKTRARVRRQRLRARMRSFKPSG
jgi:hypothetical protein